MGKDKGKLKSCQSKISRNNLLREIKLHVFYNEKWITMCLSFIERLSSYNYKAKQMKLFS